MPAVSLRGSANTLLQRTLYVVINVPTIVYATCSLYMAIRPNDDEKFQSVSMCVLFI